MHRSSGLRYLLVWPLIRRIRERMRHRLVWRLAVAHLLTVVVTLVSLFLLLWTLGLIVTVVEDPAGQEPGTDAQAVARIFTGDVEAASLDLAAQQPAVNALLGALARRDVRLDQEVIISFGFATPRRLDHARWLSVVNEGGTIIASSDPLLIGRPVDAVSPAAAAVAERALAGSTDRRANSIIRRDGESAAVGAFPFVDPRGEWFAVVVDKSDLSNPRGWSLLGVALVELVATMGLNLLLVLIPGVIVAAAIGIPLARSIVRPVRQLSGAARAVAGGDLTRRVEVDGEDEVAALATSFNEMADDLDTTMTQEAAERARVEQRTRELAALLEISRVVTSTLELQPLVGLILDQLRSVVDYTGAALLTLDDGMLTVVDARSFETTESERGLRMPADAWPLIWQRLSRFEPVIIADVRAEEPFAADFRAAVGDRLETPPFRVVRSWLAAPLAVQERVIGVLAISRNVPGAFTEVHARLVRAVADQAALAIENARLYEHAASLAALEERTRLARDLHDSVTQSIFSLRMMARVAQAQHERGGADLNRTLERISAVAADTLAEMRALIFELRPAALEEDGLHTALPQLIASFQSRTDAEVSITSDSTTRLAPDTETALFRIVQEALGNAVKHAHARRIAVRVAEQDGTLAVTVTDDGEGFNPEATTVPSGDEARGGVGLRSMQERAAAAGIVLRIESAPGAGTTVIAQAPIPSRNGIHPHADDAPPDARADQMAPGAADLRNAP
ncbi:MAG: HAMP domain-containing protein [Dehalococcoidia bacterium]